MEIKSAEQRREKGKSLYGSIIKNSPFVNGDKVLILSGEHKGDKGKIVNIEEWADKTKEIEVEFKDGAIEFFKSYSSLQKTNAIKNSSADRPIEYKGYTITASSDESEWIVTKGGKDLYHGNSAQDCKDWIDRR